jgi:hypothetical protein
MTGPTVVTSAALWRDALFFALLDLPLGYFLARRLPKPAFRKIRTPLVVAAAIFWGAFGFSLVRIFWNGYYRFFYPEWLASGGIVLLATPMFSLLAWAFHALAVRLPGIPMVTFYLLAGAESVLEHLLGILAFGILTIPLLHGIDPLPMLAFAIPEYILYWSIVILLAMLLQALWGIILHRRAARGHEKSNG